MTNVTPIASHYDNAAVAALMERLGSVAGDLDATRRSIVHHQNTLATFEARERQQYAACMQIVSALRSLGFDPEAGQDVTRWPEVDSLPDNRDRGYFVEDVLKETGRA